MATSEITGSELQAKEAQNELRGEWAFFSHTRAEVERAARTGAPGCLVYLWLEELPRVIQQAGLRGEAEVRDQLARLMLSPQRPLDVGGQDGRGRFMLLLPETSPETAWRMLQNLTQRIVAREFSVHGEPVHFTPRFGFAPFAPGLSTDNLRLQAQQALAHAVTTRSAAPAYYNVVQPAASAAPEPQRERRQAPRWLAEPLEEPLTDIADSARERWQEFQKHPLARAYRRVASVAAPAAAVVARKLSATFASAAPAESAPGLQQIRAALFDRNAATRAPRPAAVLLVLLALIDGFVGLGLRPASYLLLLPLLYATALVWSVLAQEWTLGTLIKRRMTARRTARGERDIEATNRLRQTVQPARVFAAALAQEKERADRGGTPGCVAVLRLTGLAVVRGRLGAGVETALLDRIAALTLVPTRPLDLLGRAEDDALLLLMPETTPHEAGQWLDELVRRLGAAPLEAGGETIRLLPGAGFAPFGGVAANESTRQARVALRYNHDRIGAQPAAYDPLMDDMSNAAAATPEPAAELTLPIAARTALLIGAALLLGVVVPFLLIAATDAALADPVPALLLIVSVAVLIELVRTALGARSGLRHVAEPPEPDHYPEATAIIGAHLPEDAPLLIATVNSFLEVDYPAPRTLILAYSTRDEEAAEPTLEELAARHRRLRLLRVDNGRSRAGLLGPALELARGEMIALFDADHHPAPDSLQRAWRRLAAGAEVVQGNSPARNAALAPLASISAVDGAARFLRDMLGRQNTLLPVLRSSNSYWRADVLRDTPLAAFAAGEEITAWQSPVAGGYNIVTDPALLAAELAPVSLRQLWTRLCDAAQARLGIAPRQVGATLQATPVAPIKKLSLLYFIMWTRALPWIAGFYLPLLLFALWRTVSGGSDVPLLVLLPPLLLLISGAIQAFLTYRVATPELRQSRRSFLLYPVGLALFLGELTWLASRAEQIDLLVSKPGRRKRRAPGTHAAKRPGN